MKKLNLLPQKIKEYVKSHFKVNFSQKKFKEYVELYLEDSELVSKDVAVFLDQAKKTAFPNDNKILISGEDISYSYKKNRIFDKASFEFKRGDKAIIWGPNGCGKTTLSSICLGILKPSHGKIKYGFKYKETPSEKIGIIFQQKKMLDTLTVLDYIAFNAGIYDSTIHTKEIALLTVYFLLGEKIKSKVSNLSGGQKQRLNALLAFTHLPEIVFVDEVTNEIDKKGRKLILDFIKDYFTNKNITLISISHDLYETEKLGEKVYEIKDRKIIESKEIIPKLKKMSKSLHDYENVF